MLSFILHPLIPTLFPSPSKDPRLFRSAEPNITDQTCLPFALSRLVIVLHTRCPAEQGRPPVGRGGDAQRCSPGSKLANNRNFDYSENTFVYYFLKEKCLEHPKALCSAIFLLA